METNVKYDMKDGGMASRKMWMTAVAMAFCFIGGIGMMALVPSIATQIPAVYPTFVGAILTLSSVYQGSNLMNKWIVLKNGKPAVQDAENVDLPTPEPTPEPPPAAPVAPGNPVPPV